MIKMKPVDVKSNTYKKKSNTSKKINKKNPKFKIGDTVRISKQKNIFPKGYTPNWPEENFVIKKVKNTVPWTYIISDLKAEEIVGTFLKQSLHEKQHFRKNSQRKYHLSPKTKIKENIIFFIISDIFRNKSTGQDFNDK